MKRGLLLLFIAYNSIAFIDLQAMGAFRKTLSRPGVQKAAAAAVLAGAGAATGYYAVKNADAIEHAYIKGNIEKYPEYRDKFTQYALEHLDTVDPLALQALIKKYPDLKDTITNARINNLKVDLAHKKSKFLDSVNDKALTSMYKNSRLIEFYIPQKKLTDNPSEIDKILADTNQKLFARVYAWPRTTPKQPWTIKKDDFKNALTNPLIDSYNSVPLDQAPEILETAKSILKSFVPTAKFNAADQEFNENFIDKEMSIGRLFTYAKLQRVIDEKKLSHVHLPLKILLIEDKKTGEYITGDKALDIIDKLTKLYIHRGRRAEIVLDNNDYDFKLLAHREKNYEIGSKEALKDMISLVSDAPFDVGYGNIFMDENGDARIIDTENKGEPSEHSIPKLGRYWWKKE